MPGRRLSRAPAPRPAAPARHAIRRAALTILLLVAGLATPAIAEAETAGTPDRAEIARWKGRICTPLGCAGPPGSTLASVAGFGAAVLAGAFVARRSAARRAAG